MVPVSRPNSDFFQKVVLAQTLRLANNSVVFVLIKRLPVVKNPKCQEGGDFGRQNPISET